MSTRATWQDFEDAFKAYAERKMQDFIEKRGWYPDHAWRDEWRKDYPDGGYIVKSLADAYEQEFDHTTGGTK